MRRPAGGEFVEVEDEGAPGAGRAEAKRRWRRQIRALRDSLTPARREGLSRLLCRRLEALLASLGAGTIAAYSPVNGEAALSGLWEGPPPRRSFCFPRIENGGMRFRAVTDPRGGLIPGAHGIPAPAKEAQAVEPARLDAVLAPGLVFDRFGGRIGSGKGYYDRFFGPLDNRPPLVGVGFSFQLVWDKPLPVGAGDLDMDWIVTDREALKCLPRT